MSMIESFINKLEETRRNAFLTIGDCDNEKLGEAYQIISRIVEDSIKMIRFLSAKLSESVLNDGWHVVEEKDLPEVSEYGLSKKFLLQTRQNDMFIGTYRISSYNFGDEVKVYEEWYSYGTGGRRMKVKGKVVAWMELPELWEKGE